MQDRVCFFSEYDLSVGYHLELAEKRVIEIANDNIPQDLKALSNFGILDALSKAIANCLDGRMRILLG